jgi:GntR family transcriptional regulator / MocR family aminotransferase
MRIPLDRRAQVPLYRQLEGWFRHAISDGAIPPGTKLPASRALATQLGVARVTVTAAYAGLEADGLVVTREGGGTYAASRQFGVGGAQAPTSSTTLPPWQRDLAEPEDDGAGAGEGHLGQGHLGHAPPGTRPDFVGFAGVGDPRMFPAADFGRTLQDVLRRDPAGALGYGADRLGHRPLRETIAQLLASQGVRADPEQVLVTSGSQQALALVCQTLVRPGDTVVVEDPTYDLALQLFRSIGAVVVAAPTDRDGMVVEGVEPLLQRHHPRLLYTVPNFANPTGACMTGARRRLLLELADRYNTPVVEDDFAGDLRYEGRAQPAIRALDPGGHVIYTGTFSKMLMPGLRIGYLVADQPVLGLLAARKRVLDLSTPTLLQHALDRYVTVGRYQAHLRRTTRAYRARRDALVAGLRREVPELTLEVPRGGLFAWPLLPPGVTATELLPVARRHGVGFAPGPRFHVDPRYGQDRVRLNFAAHTPDEIARGAQRLGVAMRSMPKTS